MGIRVAVIDDNPHVRWHGQAYPVNATFHRFLSAFLDLEGSPVASIAHVVPLRELPDAEPQPQTLPLDPRLEVAGTAPFDGIAGYLRRLPMIIGANRAVIARVVHDADLVWIKVPASNAALAAAIALRSRKHRFTWVAGSARQVAEARFTGASQLAGILVGAAYDAMGRVAGLGGTRVVVGRGLLNRGGIVASLLEPGEIRPVEGPWPQQPGRLHLAWAGRIAEGKGIETLLDALAQGPSTSDLAVLGDGPAREILAASAAGLGIADRVSWHGYVGDRQSYLARLAAADAFVFPSPAEGFPKVILDAMAVGLPVVASPAGSLQELATAGLIEPVAPRQPGTLVATLNHLAAEPAHAQALRRTGAEFAQAHTRLREAQRLVDVWRAVFRHLPWDSAR